MWAAFVQEVSGWPQKPMSCTRKQRKTGKQVSSEKLIASMATFLVFSPTKQKNTGKMLFHLKTWSRCPLTFALWKFQAYFLAKLFDIHEYISCLSTVLFIIQRTITFSTNFTFTQARNTIQCFQDPGFLLFWSKPLFSRKSRPTQYNQHAL